MLSLSINAKNLVAAAGVNQSLRHQPVDCFNHDRSVSGVHLYLVHSLILQYKDGMLNQKCGISPPWLYLVNPAIFGAVILSSQVSVYNVTHVPITH